MYKLDNGSYPSTEQGLESLISPPATGENFHPNGDLEGILKKANYHRILGGMHLFI